MVGYGACHNRNQFLYVDNLAVIPSYRRKGLGSLFMRYFFRIGQENNCSVVLLQVNVNNRTAITMYEKMGFKTIRILKDYYKRTKGKHENALLMKAEIKHDIR